MEDTLEPVEAPTRDDEMTITVEHDSYYRWLPVKDDEVSDDDVIVESTFDGFKLRRVIVQEPTVSTTNVHLPSVRQINADRKLAGLGRRPHHANLAQHLADGPWPRHFPLDSLTDISCDDPKWEAWLRQHFFEEDV